MRFLLISLSNLIREIIVTYMIYFDQEPTFHNHESRYELTIGIVGIPAKVGITNIRKLRHNLVEILVLIWLGSCTSMNR